MDGDGQEIVYSELSPYAIPYAKRHSNGGMHILDKDQLKEQKKLYSIYLNAWGRISLREKYRQCIAPCGNFRTEIFYNE
eukprot:TRINITY_DN2384_c0_g1_i1.p2 TRINITY_DN2384_c0_g1~~TRINITY_DN2384_c0_g1_i1.p2  ORF type:complete len:79 (-),score=16.21 TRINITY_DN2384_c0_g1_i1:77-313(-)